MAYGKEVNRDAKVEQQRVSEELAATREVPLEELWLAFDRGDVAIEYESHLGMKPKDFVLNPLSKEFTDKYPNQSSLLAANTSTYDADQEDLLYEDPLLAGLIDWRVEAGLTNDDEMKKAIRVRRSILAMVLFETGVVLEMPENRSLPSETDGDDTTIYPTGA